MAAVNETLISSITELGQAGITLIGSAGSAMMNEPYIYFIALGIAFGAISMGIGLLLRRKGRKSRR